MKKILLLNALLTLMALEAPLFAAAGGDGADRSIETEDVELRRRTIGWNLSSLRELNNLPKEERLPLVRLITDPEMPLVRADKSKPSDEIDASYVITVLRGVPADQRAARVARAQAEVRRFPWWDEGMEMTDHQRHEFYHTVMAALKRKPAPQPMAFGRAAPDEAAKAEEEARAAERARLEALSPEERRDLLAKAARDRLRKPEPDK
jgi:hypothetical protein